MSEAALSVMGLHKRFGDDALLRGVTLRVGVGETVALIGPSGGGKSTLLRCVLGLTEFDAGDIRAFEHVLVGGVTGRAAKARNFEAARALRRTFGLVFQDFQLFPHLTARENVALAQRLVQGRTQAEALVRSDALLDRVGLAHRRGAYPRALSGGEKQRVAIARALALEPRGLLCDEITSALDPELKREVTDVLSMLRRDGLSLLLVTHELQFAERAADRVVFMAHGEVLEEGPPATLLRAPRHARTRGFLGLPS